MPKWLRGSLLRALFKPLARFLLRWYAIKYPYPYDVDVVRGKLEKVRATLKQSGGAYLTGKFSYAGAGAFGCDTCCMLPRTCCANLVTCKQVRSEHASSLQHGCMHRAC
jgi:hypothetical protein